MFIKVSLAVSLHHFAPLSHIPMHIDIANGGFDGPLVHEADFAVSPEQPDPVLMRELDWREAVERVFSRRRNVIAKALQRWTCVLEIALRGQRPMQAGSV
jgi:hypothetical protein